MNVFIVGAGPGDPELITVKGQKLLSEADVIIYAGSLVNPALLDYAKAGCEIHNSASMTLPQVINVIEAGVKHGKMVVRLHTGDPSIYGAIQEQMDALDKLGIEYKVVPGPWLNLQVPRRGSRKLWLLEEIYRQSWILLEKIYPSRMWW